MAEPQTFKQLEIAKLNIFSDNEGGDVDLELSVIAWTSGRPVLRVKMTAAAAWFGFALDLDEADTFAEQIRLGALALRGVIAERKAAKETPTPKPSDVAQLPDSVRGEPHPRAADMPQPPWDTGSETNCKIAGWKAFFDGEPRAPHPFPPSRQDLKAGYEEGWDAAEAFGRPTDG